MNSLNFDDYKAALLVLTLKNKLDRFGDPMVDQSDIDWAKAYLSAWWKAIHKAARKMIGHYWCRLSLAWKSLVNGLHLKAKSTLFLTDRYCMKEMQANRIKCRTAKSGKRIRAAVKRQANRLNKVDIWDLLAGK